MCSHHSFNHGPSMLAFAFPMMVGASWNMDAEQRNGDRLFDLKIAAKVVAEEELHTAVGTMRTLRVEREVRWKRRNSKEAGVNKWVIWYNPAVKRYVAGEQLNITHDGKTLINERYELASYSVK